MAVLLSLALLLSQTLSGNHTSVAVDQTSRCICRHVGWMQRICRQLFGAVCPASLNVGTHNKHYRKPSYVEQCNYTRHTSITFTYQTLMLSPSPPACFQHT